MFAMFNKTSMEWAVHARLDLMVLCAMLMGRLAVTTKILIMENLYLCHRAMVEQQPAAPGVSGVAGEAALPPVEEEHNMQQEIWQNTQQLGVSCAMGHL